MWTTFAIGLLFLVLLATARMWTVFAIGVLLLVLVAAAILRVLHVDARSHRHGLNGPFPPGPATPD
jgi:hypothetical protein